MQGIAGEIESGVVDQRIHFYTGATGLASGTTIKKKRGTAASSAWAGSVDIVEDTVTGLYGILVSEETTVTVGKTSEMLTLILTNATITTPVILHILLRGYPKVNVKQINDTTVLGAGTSGNKWRG